MFKFLYSATAVVVRALYSLCQNYGITMILVAVLVNTITIPLARKKAIQNERQRRAAPKIKAIEAEYVNDRKKMEEEIARIYEEEKASPTVGCLLSIIPFFILISLYGVISNPLTYLMELSGTEIQDLWIFFTNEGLATGAFSQISLAKLITEFSSMVAENFPNLAYTRINFNFLGMDLSQMPNWKLFWSGDPINANSICAFCLPLISIISHALSGALLRRVTGEKSKVDIKDLKTLIAPVLTFVLLVWVSYSVPAAICVYWIAQRFISVGVSIFSALRKKKKSDISSEEETEEEHTEVSEDAIERKDENQ